MSPATRGDVVVRDLPWRGGDGAEDPQRPDEPLDPSPDVPVAGPDQRPVSDSVDDATGQIGASEVRPGTDEQRGPDDPEVVSGDGQKVREEQDPVDPPADGRTDEPAHPDEIVEPAERTEAEEAGDARWGGDRLPELTDVEYAEHVQAVDAKIRAAESRGLATNEAHTRDEARTAWTPERRRVHNEILAEMYDEATDAPKGGEAIIAGGLGGAGKSTVLGEYADVDRSRYLIINPDEVKERLAGRGLVPEVEGTAPMEASSLVHEESSHVANRLAERAYADRKNVIWDITMSSPGSVERRVEAMRAAGYERIDAVFVDIPVEMSVDRAMGRHRRGLEDHRNGQGSGGRYVPASVIRDNEDPEWGSRNRATFEELKDRFDSWQLFDNSRPGEPPVLIDADEQTELHAGDDDVHDEGEEERR